MDLESLRKLAAEHPYVLLALIIGLLIRLMKSDTKLPLDIPPAARKYVAALLAVGGAVVERLAMHVPIGQAIVDAICAWAIAEWGHTIIVDGLRGGKELPIPGLMIPGASPSPGKPPSIPPPPKTPNLPPGITGLIAAFLLFAFIAFLQACLPVKDPSNVKEQSLTVIQKACIAANAFLPDQKAVMIFCKIADVFGPDVADLILAQKKAALARGDGKAGIGGDLKPVCISGDELVVCTP